MTETTPIATVCTLKPGMENWPEDQEFELRAKQGLPSPCVEIRAVRDQGEVKWDGNSPGELEIRGPFIAASYNNLPEERNRWTEGGWLRTGDVVTIDPEGYMNITDRTKDLIKSGGEWISSVDVENVLVAHPAVMEAAVVAVPHPKWQERPLAAVVLKESCQVTPEELRSFLICKFAKWQVPDECARARRWPRLILDSAQKRTGTVKLYGIFSGVAAGERPNRGASSSAGTCNEPVQRNSAA
jgi:fatty-acyl-CoA synthase